ncbi:MAG: substrate-binding domain-containing protein [Pseudomonadota bacterium]
MYATPIRSSRLLALAAGALLASAAQASSDTPPPPPKVRPAGQEPLVQWVVPAVASAKPQTKEQSDYSIANGRRLVEPEILQPRLDADLPAYKPRTDIKLSGTFKGAASDVLPALVKRWFDGFQKMYPNVHFVVGAPYAGSLGARELVKAKTDFVFVSRELKPDDMTDFKAKFGYDPLSVPISGGSYRHFGFLDTIGFYVNKDNPIEKLSYDQIDALYSSTHHRGGKEIKTWGELGLTGEWADKPIHLYGIKPWNGFEEFIRQKILSSDGKRGEWRDDIHFDKQVFPAAGRVEDDRYGIGYSGIAYIDSAVKMLPLAEKAGGPYYAPSYENVALATYPLSRLVYFNTNKKPGQPLPPVLEEFLRYVLSKQGQQAVLDHAIYVPLRASQVGASRALLEK